MSYQEPGEDDDDIQMNSESDSYSDVDRHASDTGTLSNKRTATSVVSSSKRQKRILQLSTLDDSSDASTLDDNDDDDDDDEFKNMLVDDDHSEVENLKPKTKRGHQPKKSTTVSKNKTLVTKVVNTAPSKKNLTNLSAEPALQKELLEKIVKEHKAYKPQNNPQKLPSQPYVDPVGVDPTHGIIEGIISAQVAKVGRLLTSLDTCPDAIKLPIRLQTACSGTDAPSIALSLIQESLDKLAPKHNFAYEHVMSCEIEPFKQAYLGRNFPGVPLFPDITKLSASTEVLDVYGRPQQIPPGNVFVAGTSCKDFSMLKTRDRQDIEDKGTSGETFLAAVEFLDKFKPPMAIFENVDGAPWAKMQEYITGRIELAERNNTKAIKDAKKKAGKHGGEVPPKNTRLKSHAFRFNTTTDADKELIFSVNEKGQYVAEEIPRQVGIRAGAIVEGFVRSGDDATNVRPLQSTDTKKRITLGEIAKKHKINLEADTLILHKKARYCTHLSKLDTKDYGLPQTRNRKYLFLWRSDTPEDDLGDYYQEILKHLETPLLHSMDAFFLPDSHDRIRCFREALRSGPGLMVKRERAKELDFWDWELSHVQDLPRHKVFRQANGIEERSRWLTGWDTRGRKALAPGLWPELFDCWNMRRLDMVDCFAAAAGKSSTLNCGEVQYMRWLIQAFMSFKSAILSLETHCITPSHGIYHRMLPVLHFEHQLLE